MVLLLMIVVLFLGQGLAGAASIVPNAGTWTGSKVEFNVSADGSKITTSGSTLPNGAAIIFWLLLTSSG